MTTAIDPLGIDSVFFTVTDLELAVAFYLRCGFRRKLQLDSRRMAILSIGHEMPHLVLTEDHASTRGRLWVEVTDALAVTEALRSRGLQPHSQPTASGNSCELSDADGNVLGFVDYLGNPAMARPARAQQPQAHS